MAEARTIKAIRESVAEWYDQYYSSLGDAFAHVAVRDFFELDDDEALEACDVGGPGDRGVDAYRHDDTDRQIVVAQAKWSGKRKTFDRQAVSDLASAWTALQHLGVQERPRAREQVAEAAREVQQLRSLDPLYPVGLYCFAAGDFSEQAVEAAEAFNREHADEGVAMRLVSLDQLAEAREQAESRTREETVGDVSLKLSEHFEFRPADGEPRTIIAAVNAVQLAEAERQYQYRIFQRNVRFFLTAKRRENKGMAQTLSRPDGRDRFWFFNNGITIVCDDVKINGDEAVVSNMQIVNGCQTTTTLGEHIDQLQGDDHPVHVLVRIISGPDELLQSQISLYTNRQNQVKDRDLQSNDDLQARIQAEFDQLSPRWFYQRKRGEWEAKVKAKPSIKARYGDRRLDNEKVAQAAYAFYVDAGVARARKAFLFVRQTDDSDRGLYEDIFNTRTTPEWLLLPAKLSVVVAAKRSEFMRELKMAESADSPDLEQIQTLRREWIKFADQYFLGAMGYYLSSRVTLDTARIERLIADDTFDVLATRLYAQARLDLEYFFTGKHREAEEKGDLFVAANFVKGNWREGRDAILPFLRGREELRRDIGEDVLAAIGALAD